MCSIQLFFTGAYCKYSIAFWTPNGKCDRNTARLHCVSVTFTCQQGSASQWKERETEEETYTVVYGHGIPRYTLQGRVTIQATSRQLIPAEARVRSQKSQYGLRGGQRGTWTDFFPRTSIPRQYHYTNDPYSDNIHLPQPLLTSVTDSIVRSNIKYPLHGPNT